MDEAYKDDIIFFQNFLYKFSNDIDEKDLESAKHRLKNLTSLNTSIEHITQDEQALLNQVIKELQDLLIKGIAFTPTKIEQLQAKITQLIAS